jgi:structural maintenance of chromosome 3 (chondroitin sulfate proteoglycan 6)
LFRPSYTKITSLTNAKDSDRLNLLKEVAGTKVYEQRRQESLKIMDETDSKSTKIDELLQYIEERLAELETEKEELREYQEKDKERRCLDYALKDADLQRIDLQIAELDQLQRNALGRDGDDKAEFEEREKEIEVSLSSNCPLIPGTGDLVDRSAARHESESR